MKRHARPWAAITLQALTLVPSLVSAQSEEDALRTAAQHPGGTARSNALGNAFGAVGADPVSISINPAGFALYRSTSLSLSLGLGVVNDRSLHYGSTTNATDARVSIPNLAFVMRGTPKEQGWFKGGTYGVVYDRIATHHVRTDALAERVPGTMLTQFVNQANGTPSYAIYDAFPFGAALAWDLFAIDTVPGDTLNYFSGVPADGFTRQRDLIESSGATTRTGFFYAANFDDRIYLGASMNIIGHRYRRTLTHTEYSLEPNNEIEQVEFQERLITRASGVELSIGALFRVTERLRAGAAFHGPQWLSLNDAYTTTMRAGYASVGARGDFDQEAESPDGSFAYRLTAPWRAVVSAAYVAGANGLVSIDYEYADAANMRYRRSATLEDPYDFESENLAIRSRFVPQHSVRVGTEWRFSNWYGRAGWGFVSDPYRAGDILRGQGQRNYAAGIGYRGQHVTLDFSANYAVQGVRYHAYDPELVDAVVIDRGRFGAMVTIGLRP
ncbi:MAG: hypothetical protein IPM12_07455 [Flavobacteriales bacterium]|nr:hypothetical protein [Flavobacteriales bacterium]